MYLTFFQLKQAPFHITPDPEFLYLSPSHKEALAAITYGIEQKKGFMAIFGAAGVGKTTVLQHYLDSADKKDLKIIPIFQARLTFEAVLKRICQDLHLELNTSDTMEILNSLYQVLLDEHKQGNSVVIVVDEAQNMPTKTLESLRMLSNLETTQDKLIQIVFIGRMDFLDTLYLTHLSQLRQRIAAGSVIRPLTRDESLEYVEHRLRRAGAHNSTIFTKSTLNAIIKKAVGIPGVINVLCDNALITGFHYQQKPIGNRIIREVIADFEAKNRHQRLDQIVLRDGQTGLYDEAYFNEFLALEKKRCQRFKNSMPLMLVDLSAFTDVSERQRIAKSIMDTLSHVTRDTDIKGWHIHGLVVGIIFTETACEEATSQYVLGQVANRCLEHLLSHLGVESYSRIQISWQSVQSGRIFEMVK